MSLPYIRKTYGVPAYRGRGVTLVDRHGDSWRGRVVSARGTRVCIRWDCGQGPKGVAQAPYHPTDERLTYDAKVAEGMDDAV